MPEMGTGPVNKYLPPRPKTRPAPAQPAFAARLDNPKPEGFLGWLDAALDKLG